MREQIEAWIRELHKANANNEALQSLHDFLQCLLEYDGQYKATEYARQLDALHWCLDRLQQGKQTPGKEAVSEALYWAYRTVAAHWSYRAMQLDLHKRLRANGAEDIPAQIPNTSAFDLTPNQLSYAWGLLRERTGKFFPPAEPTPMLELTGGESDV